MEHKGFNEVRGQYVDRVSDTGALSKLATEPNLFAQYPLQCQVIKTVANGRDFKTMAYRGYWRTDRGNHQVIRPARAIGYIGGKNRGGGEDLFHLTPYSKFQDLYHYQCAGHDDALPPLVKCAEKGAKTKGWTPSRYQGAEVAVHHFKWHEGVLASIKDRLEFYRGDDPKNPRYAWYTDSEKLMASIGETGRVDVKKTSCKKSQPGAMVRGRNRRARLARRRRSRALLSETSDASSEETRIIEENKQMEAEVDVAEATLEVLEDQEGERATQGLTETDAGEQETEAEASAGGAEAEAE